MSEYIVVLCTVPDKDTGKIIAQSLLEKKLCACVNITANVDSLYLWQDRIEQSNESMLFIKTLVENYKELERNIKLLHPYDNPEVIMLNIAAGSADYFGWIKHSIDK